MKEACAFTASRAEARQWNGGRARPVILLQGQVRRGQRTAMSIRTNLQTCWGHGGVLEVALLQNAQI